MRRILLAAVILLGRIASAQLTTVTDTIILPNGQMPSGSMTLSWQGFLNAAHQQIPAGTNLVVPVVNGAFSVQLSPTDVAIPYGVCYTVATDLTGMPRSVTSWYVPTSTTPVNLNTVQSLSRCAPQVAANVALAQLTNSGANVGQCIVWATSVTGAYWKPGSCGSGGGSPGGTNGQIQINSVGSFAGFTPGGDVTFSNPNFRVISTNGVAFAPSATVNALNASNISSGTLGVAVGGTGAGALTAGSVPFIGTLGVYSQDNANFFYDSANHCLAIGSTGCTGTLLNLHGENGAAVESIQGSSGNNSATLQLISGGGGGSGDHALINFYKGSNVIWRLAGVFNGLTSFGILNANTACCIFEINQTSNDISIGGTGPDLGYKLDVQSSGASGTFRVYDQTATTGVTQMVEQAGAGQSTTALHLWNNNAGTLLSQIDATGGFGTFSSFLPKLYINQTFVQLSSDSDVQWKSSTNVGSGGVDTALYRNAAGVLEIDNGTAGTYRDLILRNLDINSIAGGGTQCLHVNNIGQVSGTGFDCGGGGGSGTVTSVVIAATAPDISATGTCTITTTGTCTLDLVNTSVTPNTYTNGTFTVDAKGRLTGASNGNIMTVAGTGAQINVAGVCTSTSTGTCTASLATTAVTPGSYTASNVTVDAFGRITSISNGSTSGSVSSVGLALPGGVFAISGSPITTSGTLTGSFQTQAVNTVFAGPCTGSSATPTFRGLCAADLPIATTSAFGAVKPDGSSIMISAGVISGNNPGNAGSSPGNLLTCPSSTQGTITTIALGAVAGPTASYTGFSGSCTTNQEVDITLTPSSFVTITWPVTGFGSTPTQFLSGHTYIIAGMFDGTNYNAKTATDLTGTAICSVSSAPGSNPTSGVIPWCDSSSFIIRSMDPSGNIRAQVRELTGLHYGNGANADVTAATASQVVGVISTTPVALATNLATYPTLCSGSQFSQGLSSGSNNCANNYAPVGCTATGVSLSTSPTTLSQCGFAGVTLPSGSCRELKGTMGATSTMQLVISAGAMAISKPTITSTGYEASFDSLICNNGTSLTISPLMLSGYTLAGTYLGGQAGTGFILDNVSGSSQYPYNPTFTWGASQTISVTFASTTGTGTGTMSLILL